MNQSFLKGHSIFLRRTWRYFAAPLLITTTLLGIGYVTPRKWGLSSQSCHQPFKIYVEGDAMHVNLILPVQNQAFDWGQFLSIDQIGRDAQQRYRYLKFGWGDRDFYMNTPSWSEVKIPNVLRSLLMPGNPTALYVEGYAKLPSEKHIELKCVGVSQKDYLQLVAFIKASFQQTSQGRPIRIQDSSIATSGFYEATGHYSILQTCNTWAADGLDAANIQTPLWSGLATAVMRQIPSGCECNAAK